MTHGSGWCLLVALLLSPAAAAQVMLTEWTGPAGLSATHQVDAEGFPGPQEWMTGGAAVGDFNNDGCQDIFWVGGGGTPDKLFINACDGTGTFVDQAAAWGVASLHCGNGVAAGDYDQDGWLDIYVTSFGAPGAGGSAPGNHRLYHNEAGTGFTEVAAAAGVNYSCPNGSGNAAGYGAAFGDFNLDGLLDLAVTSWWAADDGNRLYRNNGDGTFTDVTATALGSAIDGPDTNNDGEPDGVWGFQPAFIDMDGDRYPELLFAADFETSRYLINNADGTFTDFTAASGTGLDDNGMGQAVADFNNDGVLDWYVTSIHKDNPQAGDYVGNMFYLGLGNHVYSEISVPNGTNNGGWGWGTVAVDLNHDTWTDILEVNGRPDICGSGEWACEPAKLFYNTGGVLFVEMAAVAGFDHADEGRGLVYLDADNDGDLDIVVTTNAGALTYYRNDTAGGNWLRVTLDTSANPLLAPNGFGARVTATVAGTSYVRVMSGAPSYLATSELAVHFGLGAAAEVDELTVLWPKGYVTTLTGVAANQQLTIAAPGVGDLDADGVVGILDFLGVLAAWGPCPDPPAACLADLDNDGVVGILDFLLTLANWG